MNILLESKEILQTIAHNLLKYLRLFWKMYQVKENILR